MRERAALPRRARASITAPVNCCTKGEVGDAALEAFLTHGFTREQALDVVLGVGLYTLSTYANRLTRATLDPPLEPLAWTRSLA